MLSKNAQIEIVRGLHGSQELAILSWMAGKLTKAEVMALTGWPEFLLDFKRQCVDTFAIEARKLLGIVVEERLKGVVPE